MMILRLLGIGVAASFLLSSSPPRVEAQETGRARARGSVVNERGEPIEGARVVLEHTDYDSVIERTTDENGNWIAAGLRGGNWTIDVTAEGYEPWLATVEISEARRNPAIDVTLKRGGAPPGGARPAEAVAATELAIDANEAYNAGNYQEAVELYQELLETSPELEVARLRLGSAYVQMGSYEEGIAQFELYLENHPESSEALLLMGEAHVLAGEMDEALTYLERVGVDHITDPDLAYNMGEIYFGSGELEAASEAYGRATTLRPTFHEAYYKLGLVAIARGDMEAAREHLEKVVEIAPDSPEAALARDALAQIGND